MPQKITTEIFIERAKKAHGDKYDYSKVKYSKPHGKVEIVCPQHGVFNQSAKHHCDGAGCAKCAFDRNRKWTKEEEMFLKQFYIEKGGRFCAEKLKRSHNSLITKVNRMGIRKATQKFSKHPHIPLKMWRSIINNSKVKNRDVKINRDYIWSVYQKQKGVCALTGWPISFAKGGRASVDRIDSTKGYINGNIQIVDSRANKIKMNNTDKFFYKVCEAIARHRRGDLNDGQIHFDSGEVTRKTGRLSESSCPSQEMREVEL